MGKVRLDTLLVERGLADSREKAKRCIMAGMTYVNGRRQDKPGTKVDPNARVEVRGDPVPFVSRGGLKLARALDVFPVSVRGKTVIDVGASTGGFTDCLLQNGAAKVVAIDVGYGQLDWKLRQDPRVVVMERTNIRYVTPGDLDELADMATVDVAFISLTKFLHSLVDLLVPEGEIIALIKPQFEAGPHQVGKKGVVRDPAVQVEVIRGVLTVAQSVGLGARALTFSPILGPKGNLEFLVYWQKGAVSQRQDFAAWAGEIVSEAHSELSW